MKIFISFILLNFSLIVYGQDSLKEKRAVKLKPLFNALYGSPDMRVYAPFLNKIDTVSIKKKDIQIQLWFNNGSNKINITTFIALTKLRNKWNAVYYTFTKHPLQRNDSMVINKLKPVQLRYDSLYKQLVKDSLLTLNSDSANERIIDSDIKTGTYWTDGGPRNYTIQTIINGKRKTVNFKCPNYYYTQRGIKEFECPMKVISLFLKLIGLEESC